MSDDFNLTHTVQTHRILLASSKHVTDRTRLYIFSTLFILSFILVFYLLYNFISYRRYSSARRRRHKKTKSSSYFFDCLTTRQQTRQRLYSYESLSVSAYRIPLRPIITDPSQARHSASTTSQFVSEF